LKELPSARLLAGEEHVEPMLVRNVVVATGEDRWLRAKTSSLRDAEGTLVRVVNVIEDVTEVKRTERAQALLSRASEALASTLDYEAALQGVADAIVPALADWAGVDMLGRGGRIEQVALAHTDPERVELARRLRERYPASSADPDGIALVLREGRSQLIAEIPDAALVAGARDEEHLAMLREVGLASAIIVPLVTGSETLGTLTLVSSDPLRPYGQPELELAEELGRRAGGAVLTARQYNRRTAIAQALQHGLLPPDLPDVAGWASAVLYRPAGELNEVGGDFYDVFAGPEGWMLVIGDVAGQGAEAAARTSLARFTLRTAANLTGDPSRALVALNDALRAQAGLPLCTAVCASLTPCEGGGARLCLAVAGHPPPLLVRGREVTPLGHAGTIAGAFDGETWPVATVDVVPGDVIVLYTDGVLDAVGEDDRFGEDRLHAALRELDGTVQERLSGLNAVLRDFQRGPQRDDTTVLVLEYRGAAEDGTTGHAGAREREASR
ncbi:MAG: hypothetical protein QOE28_2183, partial [Solirubrobacteraceae bacterium]|nr:hypothetical protein [Solirubrobacteraceae bacterium]